MFTGIIEEVGTLMSVSPQRLAVRASKVMVDTQMGDSIAVEGVCLTVTAVTSDGFTADMSPETVSRTTLGKKSSGDKVNLERALRLQDRLGGHLMLGHVDGIGVIRELRRDINSIRLWSSAPNDLMRYIALKGSIGVNGVSLTVSALDSDGFQAAIIPHTLQATTLQMTRTGDYVNLEVDILSRYLERLMIGAEVPESLLNERFLLEHGFV